MSNLIIPSGRDYTLEELEKIYGEKTTEEVQASHKRFKTVQEQAAKRCRAAMNVLTFRAKDNHKKPPTQVIRPCAMRAEISSRQ